MITNTINSTMTGLFGRSWRTSLFGVISAITGFIAAYPDVVKNEAIVNLCKFLSFAGFAAFGISAKDRSVSGVALKHRDDDTYAEDEAQGR